MNCALKIVLDLLWEGKAVIFIASARDAQRHYTDLYSFCKRGIPCFMADRELPRLAKIGFPIRKKAADIHFGFRCFWQQKGTRWTALALFGKPLFCKGALCKNGIRMFCHRSKIHSTDPALDAMFNFFVPYQMLFSRIYARCGFLSSERSLWFRDQLQDSNGCCIFAPKSCKIHYSAGGIPSILGKGMSSIGGIILKLRTDTVTWVFAAVVPMIFCGFRMRSLII